jgi:DNA-binding beta-propeller fold protein YncE
LCSDAAGNVWIVNDGANQIVEYKHGGSKPVATLSDPGEYPEGCSVDPVTGNLAVTNFYSTSGAGSVAIYAHAAGSPTLITDAHFSEYRFCGYDNKGDLYVDGVSSSSGFVFAELLRGKKVFSSAQLKQAVEWPGGVSFDGKDIAVGDTDASKVYITSGKEGNIVGTVLLTDANYVNQFWIVPSTDGKANAVLVAPSQDGNVVGMYAYPAGNAPKKKITVQEPFGVTVSGI